MVNPSEYEHFMTLVAEVTVRGGLECNLENKMAAFVGEEVRGVASPYSHLGCAIYNLIVYSNSLTDTVTFGAYLADEDVAAAATNIVTFESGAGLGTPDKPYTLKVE